MTTNSAGGVDDDVNTPLKKHKQVPSGNNPSQGPIQFKSITVQLRWWSTYSILSIKKNWLDYRYFQDTFFYQGTNFYQTLKVKPYIYPNSPKPLRNNFRHSNPLLFIQD